MKKKIFVVVISHVVLVLSSCNSNPVDSPSQPGRRDYTWTVDEINPGQESLNLGRIWGSSPSDVWAVGSSSWTATSIWYYNGIKWSCDSIPRRVTPSAIFGFSRSEVWLGNSNFNLIWKYDGKQWAPFGEYKIEGYDQLFLNYFDGLAKENIYAVGSIGNNLTYKAVIMHYDGIGWRFVNIPDTKVGLETAAIDPLSGILVTTGEVYDPSGFVAKVYCWDGGELKELLSGSGWPFVTKLGGEIFVTLASKIYKYANKRLVLWKDITNTGISGNIICGRSRNDFFIGASDGIRHFNGIDFSTVYKKESGHNVAIERGVVFEKDVFFIANDFTIGRNLIIHGKLN